MVRTKSMTANPENQEVRETSSHPNPTHDPSSTSIQQQLQSMTIVVAKLMKQNKELAKKVHKKKKHSQHRHADQEEPGRDQEDRGANSYWKIWFCIAYKTHSRSNNHGSTSFM